MSHRFFHFRKEHTLLTVPRVTASIKVVGSLFSTRAAQNKATPSIKEEHQNKSIKEETQSIYDIRCANEDHKLILGIKRKRTSFP